MIFHEWKDDEDGDFDENEIPSEGPGTHGTRAVHHDSGTDDADGPVSCIRGFRRPGNPVLRPAARCGFIAYNGRFFPQENGGRRAALCTDRFLHGAFVLHDLVQ